MRLFEKPLTQSFHPLVTGLIFTLLSLAFVLVSFALGQTREFSLEGSTVYFEIDEVLLGRAKTVVGAGNLVSGTVVADFESLENSTFGEVIIDARDFETDNRRRNASIQNKILETEIYPFIIFEGSVLRNVLIADELTAELLGVLTIKGVSRDVIFDVVLSEFDASRVVGTASAIINYKDFGIVVPPVPMVASVDEEVVLRLELKGTVIP